MSTAADEQGNPRQKQPDRSYQHLYQPLNGYQTVAQSDNPPKPGEPGNPFNETLFEKTLGRAATTIQRYGQIFRGEKPALPSGGGDGNKWRRGQLDVMEEGGHLLGKATDYYTLPSPFANVSYRASSAKMILEGKDITQALEAIGIKPRITGTNAHLTPTKLKQQHRTCDVLVAPPGDLRATLEICEIYKRKLEGAKLPPLIIENTSNGWDSLLSDLQLLEQKDGSGDQKRHMLDLEKFGECYGVYVTHSRSETLSRASDLTASPNLPKREESAEVAPAIPEGATIFVATGTRKKYHELVKIYKKQGLKVNILPIDFLVEGYISPKEDQGSYEGNAAKKVQAAFEAWGRVKKKETKLAEVGHRMFELGLTDKDESLDPQKIFFLSEDSGFHFVQTTPSGKNLSTHPLLAQELGDQIHPDAPFPGTETGPNILSAFGVKNFFQTIGKIFQEYQEKLLPTTNKVVKKCALAIAPLELSAGTFDMTSVDQVKKIYVYGSETHGTFVTTPYPNTGALEIDNFLRPEGFGNKTEAELGDKWLLNHSPRGHAWDALVHDLKVPLDPKKIHKPLSEKEFRIGIVSDPSNQLAHEAIMRLVALNRLPEFSVDQISADITRLADVQTNMLEGKDAVVLAFDPERANVDFWRNTWTFASLIVGEQTRDKYKLEKPLYLINPKDDKQHGPFDYLEKLTHDLHVLGTIPQDPDTLYHSVPSAAEAVERLKKDRHNYLRYEPPEYSKGPPFDTIGDESNKNFNVVVFASATNENGDFKGVCKDLVALLAKEGMGVRTGGGLYGGMGMMTETLVAIRDEYNAYHDAYSAPHIMDNEVRGKNIADRVDRFQLCRDIYERIEGLLSVDAAIVAPGGMGTIQELAAFALLKKMALEEPTNPYTMHFINKELVVINTPIKIDGQPRGFYDALTKVIPAGDLEKLGIHIVETPEEAVDIMKTLREKKRASRHSQDGTQPQADVRAH